VDLRHNAEVVRVVVRMDAVELIGYMRDDLLSGFPMPLPNARHNVAHYALFLRMKAV
jgi:hypothetical protein